METNLNNEQKYIIIKSRNHNMKYIKNNNTDYIKNSNLNFSQFKLYFYLYKNFYLF